MSRQTLLGYHRIGEYHYFTLLKNGNQFFGQGSETFTTHEDFAGLVTAVHEHYHLMQEMLLGFCWWREDTRTNLTAETVDAISRRKPPIGIPIATRPDSTATELEVQHNDPISYAAKYAIELRNIDQYLALPSFTRQLLSIETEGSPQYARLIHKEAFELTTLDLLECQAAVLTELYISKLIAEMPQKFDERVVKELAPLFRVETMLPSYRRPLTVMLHLFDAVGLQLAMPKNAHPMYEAIKNGTYYCLAAFFMDYALHLTPSPMALLDLTPDTSTRQDIYPPFRFMNLALVWAFGVKNNKDGLAPVLTNEALYYSQVADHLCTWINAMHARVREPGTQETFFPIRSTTELWRDYLGKSRLAGRFPEGRAIAARAVELRLSNPAIWSELKPHAFDALIGLPRLYIAGDGLGAVPYIAADDPRMNSRKGKLDKKRLLERQREFLTRAMTLHYSGFGSGTREEYAEFPITLVPFRFVEESLSREGLYRMSSLLMYGETARCPLTDSVGAFVPCKARTAGCERISEPASLPASECLLRDTIGRHFGDPSGLRRTRTEGKPSVWQRLFGREKDRL